PGAAQRWFGASFRTRHSPGRDSTLPGQRTVKPYLFCSPQLGRRRWVSSRASEGSPAGAEIPRSARNDITCTRVRAARVLRRRAANNALEVPREMRLVKVAQLDGYLHDIVARGQPLRRFLQPKALYDPLRGHADVLSEEPLQAALANPKPRHEIFHARHVTARAGELYDRVDQRNRLVRDGQPREQQAFDNRHHFFG